MRVRVCAVITAVSSVSLIGQSPVIFPGPWGGSGGWAIEASRTTANNGQVPPPSPSHYEYRGWIGGSYGHGAGGHTPGCGHPLPATIDPMTSTSGNLKAVRKSTVTVDPALVTGEARCVEAQSYNAGGPIDWQDADSGSVVIVFDDSATSSYEDSEAGADLRVRGNVQSSVATSQLADSDGHAIGRVTMQVEANGSTCEDAAEAAAVPTNATLSLPVGYSHAQVSAGVTVNVIVEDNWNQDVEARLSKDGSMPRQATKEVVLNFNARARARTFADASPVFWGKVTAWTRLDGTSWAACYFYSKKKPTAAEPSPPDEVHEIVVNGR